MRPVRAACAAVALLAGVTGCAGEQPGGGPATLSAQDLSCASSVVLDALRDGGGYPGGAQVPPALPTDLDVVAVVWCRSDPVVPTAGTVPPGVPPMVVQEVTFAEGIEPLLDALAEPSQTAGPDVMCTADLEYKPVVFVVDHGGTWVRAWWPVDVCGKTQALARERWTELTPTSVVDVRLS